MIVPSTRLLLWTLIALPFTITATTSGSAPLLSIAVLTAFGGLVLVDALGATRRIRGVSASLPDTVRMSKDRASTVPVFLTYAAGFRHPVRVGIPLPRTFESKNEILVAVPPESGPHARLDWDCTPRTRGSFTMRNVYLETDSALGFWDARRTCGSATELRVYPNLLGERRRLAALFLNRGMFGVHAQRRIGQGRDFEQLREYQHGDSFEDIHWKATARHGKPYTKIYQIERTQEVYVIIDSSRLTARKLGTDTALDRFITSALVLGLAAEQHGDLFGLLTFSSKIDRFIRARSGKAHYAACRDALYTLTTDHVSPDFDGLCAFIRTRLRRRALLIVLTDLLDPVLSESFVHSLQLINRQHLVLVNTIKRPNVDPLFSTPVEDSTDELYQRLSGHMQWTQIRELNRTLHHMGISMTEMDDERMSSQLIAQYLSVKQRQLI